MRARISMRDKVYAEDHSQAKLPGLSPPPPRIGYIADTLFRNHPPRLYRAKIQVDYRSSVRLQRFFHPPGSPCLYIAHDTSLRDTRASSLDTDAPRETV